MSSDPDHGPVRRALGSVGRAAIALMAMGAWGFPAAAAAAFLLFGPPAAMIDHGPRRRALGSVGRTLVALVAFGTWGLVAGAVAALLLFGPAPPRSLLPRAAAGPRTGPGVIPEPSAAQPVLVGADDPYRSGAAVQDAGGGWGAPQRPAATSTCPSCMQHGVAGASFCPTCGVSLTR